ncbi:phosphodiester glycosidase family protein [Clostridium tepidum]|jgi:exopolysaccharide biosynthesis protein|uniref:Exopolysaccharide biosynthesis protein n=1 Tax=Clostridium tepidum TaxID=1962263 RepID=A0A1S9IBG2_9CLOT|nr:phosphodiester glycosidase family protein [Clostridium tepidum]MCR1933389.1 phosphodiester glycosidase family protein [Clostridium tepidum]MDU6878214.1 phosphodiester glycosidase family protein [Clostridium botulinum]OOO61490.1 exopolysaccharide biosynthesis protein [Clostridium tepidum]OOO67605.1 exopolysaccharide biosynthesis protein [Clostridium tepidum]
MSKQRQKNVKRKKIRKKKKKSFIGRLFLFLVYEIIAGGVFTLLLAFYGPFNNVKSTLVGTAMATYKHQYIATTFLSKDEINKILNKGKEINNSISKENYGNIKIKNQYGNSVERYDISTTKFDGYILEIKNPKKVKIGYTKYMGKMGERTSKMAERYGAVAAVNGGGFRDVSSTGKLWTGTGAYPEGLVISNGKVIYNDFKKGQKANVTAFTKDGLLVVGDYTVDELLKMGVVEALSFRNTLIINGNPIPYNEGINPRTAIGQKEDGTIVLLVIDGRRGIKQGATLEEVENILLQRGVVNASNLDGGSSSTMYYKGKVINRPCNWDGERTVATSIYVEP